MCLCQDARDALHLVSLSSQSVPQLGGRPVYKAYIIRRQRIRTRTDKLLHEVDSSPPKHQAAYRLRGLNVLISAGNVLRQNIRYQSLIQ